MSWVLEPINYNFSNGETRVPVPVYVLTFDFIKNYDFIYRAFLTEYVGVLEYFRAECVSEQRWNIQLKPISNARAKANTRAVLLESKRKT